MRRLFAVLLLVAASAALAQSTSEADNVVAKAMGGYLTQVTWDAPKGRWSHACSRISYSIYRSTDPKFDIEPQYLVASAVTGTKYIAHETTRKDVYYRVAILAEGCGPWGTDRAENQSGSLLGPKLHGGKIIAYPLDLGSSFVATNIREGETCEATSTSELRCSSLGNMHAVIAAQGGHEFLLGCPALDFEFGSWNCVNLAGGGIYMLAVHSKTATILNGGFSEINVKTGRTISNIVPVFSILATVK